MTTIVLVGGGHAHAVALRLLERMPVAGARIVLVSPEARSFYSGTVPGYLAGHYNRAALEIDLAALTRRAGVELVLDRCKGLDLAGRRVLLDRRPPLAFDFLSLDTGSTSEPQPGEGSDARVRPVKPLAPFLDAWDGFIASAATGRVPPTAAVLGGGLGGIEVALAMAHRLRAISDRARVSLVERRSRLASDLPERLRRRLARVLRARRIAVHLDAVSTRIGDDGLTLDGETRVPAAFVAAATGARSPAWLATSGLTLDDRGFVDVDARLRSVSHRNVFAVGDVAHLTAAPRPKAGVFAVRQGPVLARALASCVAGAEPPRYRPQQDYLRLVALGGRTALAVKYGIVLGGSGPLGRLLWRLKDKIDRDFVLKLNVA